MSIWTCAGGIRPRIYLLALGILGITYALERRAIPTRIEQDELNATVFRTIQISSVNTAIAQPALAIGRFAKKIEKDRLRFPLCRIVTAGIVGAVIVVVPGCYNLRQGTQAPITRLCSQLRIL